MPAIITHYLFGQEAARSLPPELIATHEELEAFMLGNHFLHIATYCASHPP